MDSIPLWTKHDDLHFEKALMQFPEGSPYFLENIAHHLQKPVVEVKYYYDALVYDVALIDFGKFALSKYKENDDVSVKEATQSKCGEKKKKKANLWSSTEQRLFLEGLEKYGQGDWKTISRLCVQSKTPQQVASHAQKYYIRKNSKKKRRSSIHDMTLGDAENVTVPGSNSKSMDQQPHCGDQILPDQFYDYLRDNLGLFDDDDDDGCLARLEELQGSSFYDDLISILES